MIINVLKQIAMELIVLLLLDALKEPAVSVQYLAPVGIAPLKNAPTLKLVAMILAIQNILIHIVVHQAKLVAEVSME